MGQLQSRHLSRETKSSLVLKILGPEVSESFFRVLLNQKERVLITFEEGENYKPFLEWCKEVDAPAFALAHGAVGIPTPIMKSYTAQNGNDGSAKKELTLRLKNCDPRNAAACSYSRNLTTETVEAGRRIGFQLAKQVDQSLENLRKADVSIADLVESQKAQSLQGLEKNEGMLAFIQEGFLPLYSLAVDAKALELALESEENLVTIYVGLAHAQAIREYGLRAGWREEVLGVDPPALEERFFHIRNFGDVLRLDMAKAYQYLSSENLPKFFDTLPPLVEKEKVCASCGGAEPKSICPCHEVRYCDKTCQTKDWPRHKAFHKTKNSVK
ncbi:MAG: zinc finger MYND domain-containing protein [Bdellovibrio sp.]|nr:zinc finger MYND domain-containing protein [Bdellovibrio sp.]